MAKAPAPKTNAAVPKVKMPGTKTATPTTPKLPTTGLAGYLNSSKLMNPPKPPKNGMNTSAMSQ